MRPYRVVYLVPQAHMQGEMLFSTVKKGIDMVIHILTFRFLEL